MARLIQNEVEAALAEKILFGEFRHGGKVRVGVRGLVPHLEVMPAKGYRIPDIGP